MQAGRPAQPSATNRPSSWYPPGALPGCGRGPVPPRPPAHAALRARPRARPLTTERPSTAGGHGGGDTPGPIPNPEAKPPSADGTAESVRGRAGRRRPTTGIWGRAPRFWERGALPFCVAGLLVFGFLPFARSPGSCQFSFFLVVSNSC